jgi:hypothetical protein
VIDFSQDPVADQVVVGPSAVEISFMDCTGVYRFVRSSRMKQTTIFVEVFMSGSKVCFFGITNKIVHQTRFVRQIKTKNSIK